MKMDPIDAAILICMLALAGLMIYMGTGCMGPVYGN